MIKMNRYRFQVLWISKKTFCPLVLILIGQNLGHAFQHLLHLSPDPCMSSASTIFVVCRRWYPWERRRISTHHSNILSTSSRQSWAGLGLHMIRKMPSRHLQPVMRIPMNYYTEILYTDLGPRKTIRISIFFFKIQVSPKNKFFICLYLMKEREENKY